MHYWDTSVLAKLYVNEVDSQQFTAHLAATGSITTSVLTRWEMFRVLARKESEGLLAKGAAEVIFNRFLADITGGKIRLVPWDNDVESHFRKIVLQLQGANPPIFTRTF